MRIIDLALLFSSALLMVSCSPEVEPFSDVPHHTISPSLRIDIFGYVSATTYFVRPDMEVSILDYDAAAPAGKKRLLARDDFAKISELLGPLINYRGTETVKELMAGKIDCGLWATDSPTATIHWNYFVLDGEKEELNLSERSDYYFGCGSNEAKAAKERIQKVAEIIENASDDTISDKIAEKQ
ncbi:MAG: hypothetical protein ABJF89_11620 [Parasphingorhabdus sp.]|uniref:hypothetical protein n=1 Tax=Parasphingorhabdus sp. TaxID=2709688 RepID=UPI003263BA29